MSQPIHQLLSVLDDSIQCASNVQQEESCEQFHHLYNDIESAAIEKRSNDLEALLFKAIDLIDKAKSQLHADITMGTVFVELSNDLAEVEATWDDLTACLDWHIKQVVKGRTELLIA